MFEVNKKNYSRIKITGKCPSCGSKVSILHCGYGKEMNDEWFPACCKNEECNNSCGYGTEIEIRMVNHRRAKVVGLYE